MSDIYFKCPHCRNPLTIDAAGAGLQVPCPHCARSITVPNKTKPKAKPWVLPGIVFAVLVVASGGVFVLTSTHGTRPSKPPGTAAQPTVESQPNTATARQPQQPKDQTTQPANATAPGHPLSWTNDWSMFVTELTKQIAKNSFYAYNVNSTFNGKEVVWTGIVAELNTQTSDSKEPYVRLAMKPEQISSAPGTPSIESLTVKPRADEWSTWKNVSIGDTVVFRTVLDDDASFPITTMRGVFVLLLGTAENNFEAIAWVNTKGGTCLRSGPQRTPAVAATPATTDERRAAEQTPHHFQGLFWPGGTAASGTMGWFVDPSRDTFLTQTNGSTDEVISAVAKDAETMLSTGKVLLQTGTGGMVSVAGLPQYKFSDPAKNAVWVLVYPIGADKTVASYKIASTAAGPITAFKELQRKFGSHTEEEVWSADDIGITGNVYWWGEAGVARGDDGTITHALLRFAPKMAPR